MGKFKVEIDKNACKGFGACVELCSRFFHLSKIDGKTTVNESEKVVRQDKVVSEILEIENLECVRDAAEACPFNAIHIADTETGERLI